MRELIAERPNQKPIGLGNSDSAIEMDSYVTGYGGETRDERAGSGSDEERDDADKAPDDNKEFFSGHQTANHGTSVEPDDKPPLP